MRWGRIHDLPRPARQCRRRRAADRRAGEDGANRRMSALAIDRRQDSLLRIADVRRRTGLSTATIYRREAAGTFPPKRKLGARSVAWYESDVGEFVADPLGYRA